MSPQKENGYTAIANEIMEALIKYRLPGAQMQCLLLILRKTYGFNKKTDSISLSQFEKFTKIARRNVIRAINQLIQKNIIYVKKGGVKNDTILISKYTFNKRFKSWNNGVKFESGSVNRGKKVVSFLTPTKDTIQKTKEIYKEKFLGIFKINVSIPSNYAIQKEHIQYALSKNLTEEQAKDQFESFTIHHQAKGTKFKSWYAAYQKWIRNGISFGQIIITNSRKTKQEILAEAGIGIGK